MSHARIGGAYKASVTSPIADSLCKAPAVIDPTKSTKFDFLTNFGNKGSLRLSIPDRALLETEIFLLTRIFYRIREC